MATVYKKNITKHKNNVHFSSNDKHNDKHNDEHDYKHDDSSRYKKIALYSIIGLVVFALAFYAMYSLLKKDANSVNEVKNDSFWNFDKNDAALNTTKKTEYVPAYIDGKAKYT